MKKLSILLTSISITFFSCQQKAENNNHLPNETNAELPALDQKSTTFKDDKNPLMNYSFQAIDSTDIYIFPLVKNSNNNRDGFKSYKGSGESFYWNILFYNSKEESTYLLTDQKILLTDVFFNNKNIDSTHINLYLNHCLYIGIQEDLNGDQELNTKDPKYLYISDKKGQGFKQISPKNEDVKEWKYIKEKNAILIVSVPDEDNDKVFEDNQPINITEYDLNNSILKNQIFPQSTKEEILKLYNHQWVKQ